MPLPLISNWWVTWFALTRQGGLDVAGSSERFLVVVQALLLLCVMMDVVMTVAHLLFFLPIILYNSSIPDSMVLLLKGILTYCFLYAS